MNEFIKPKVTRENLNSFDVRGTEIFEYLVDLAQNKKPMTDAEVIILSFLAEVNPDVKAHIDELGGVCIPSLSNKTMLLAPDWFNQEMYEKAHDFGLIPTPTECLADGTPVFTSEQIAKHLGVPVEDVLKHLDELKKLQEEEGLSGSEAYLVDASEVHKIQ